MGSINIFKPLSTVLSSADNKSQQYQEIFLGTLRIYSGAAGHEARTLFIYAMPPPHLSGSFIGLALVSFQKIVRWAVILTSRLVQVSGRKKRKRGRERERV